MSEVDSSEEDCEAPKAKVTKVHSPQPQQDKEDLDSNPAAKKSMEPLYVQVMSGNTWKKALVIEMDENDVVVVQHLDGSHQQLGEDDVWQTCTIDTLETEVIYADT